MYVQRTRFPAGFRQVPERHTCDRVVTVISGTLHIGFGDMFDEQNTLAVETGHTWTIPALKSCFLWAKNGTVLVQVVSDS